MADAQLAVARSYCFRDWSALGDFVDAVNVGGSPVFLFESAVEAVISGDLNRLESLLGAHPEHQAVLAGHGAVVQLLIERGATLDVKDRIYQGTPLGWAVYAKRADIEAYLREHGAS